jgi:hypothetical protein
MSEAYDGNVNQVGLTTLLLPSYKLQHMRIGEIESLNARMRAIADKFLRGEVRIILHTFIRK